MKLEIRNGCIFDNAYEDVFDYTVTVAIHSTCLITLLSPSY